MLGNGGYWIDGSYGGGSWVNINLNTGVVSGLGYDSNGNPELSIAGAAGSNPWGSWTQTFGSGPNLSIGNLGANSNLNPYPGAANNLGQKPKVNWFANSNCQFGNLNSKYGPGAAKFVSRFSLLSYTPLASGPSANAGETIVPTIGSEGMACSPQFAGKCI